MLQISMADEFAKYAKKERHCNKIAEKLKTIRTYSISRSHTLVHRDLIMYVAILVFSNAVALLQENLEVMRI